MFLATSALHVEMAAALRAAGRTLDLSIAAAAGLSTDDAYPLAEDAFPLEGAKRVTGARGRAAASRSALDDLRPDVLVVGNDMAPIERAVVRAARRRDLPVVLLQDGLFPAWRGDRWRGLGRTLVRSGHPELAPTLYGIGEATHFGILGPGWVAPYQRGRGSGDSVVRPVGNVVFASTIREVLARDTASWRTDIGLPDRPAAIFFTTDLLRGLGPVNERRHRNQARVVRDALDAWSRAGWTAHVRLHPAERSDDYAGLLPDGAILDRSMPLAAAIGAADVGLVSGSAVSLMLAASGRLVGWPIEGDRVAPDEGAAARWLGIPLLPATQAVSPSPMDPARLASLLADDRDDPHGSRSVRLVEEAARLH